MITFKEFYMLQEAPVLAPTPQEKLQQQQNNKQITAPGTATGSTAPAPVGAQQVATQLSNNREIQNPTQPQGRPTGIAPAPVPTGGAPAAPAAPPVPAAPAQQDPVTGPDAITNTLTRISKQTPEKQAQSLIDLKGQYDQAATAATGAAQREREEAANDRNNDPFKGDGEAVEALRGWNQSGLELNKQARNLKAQLASNPQLVDQLTQTFGENWKRMDRGLPLLIEHNGNKIEIIVA
jgi:hypothetical protein